MNILAQLEAGNVGTVINKLEQLFVEDIVDPAEPIIADVTSVVTSASQILTLLNGLINSLTAATTSLGTPVLVTQPVATSSGADAGT